MGENKGCCCGENAETSESTEDKDSTNEKKESKILGLEDTYELFTDDDEYGGCGCGVKTSDESTIDNPDNAKTMVEPDFIEKLENYAHSIGIASVGYARIPSELIITDKPVMYPNTIVLTMEMDEKIIETAPGPEAYKLNNIIYEKLGKLTYKVSDYLRDVGFATQPVHPFGKWINFSAIGQEAGLGFIGKSGLLITPELGPRHKISAIFTSIENLPLKDNEHSWIKDYCDVCGKCVKSCTENAMIERKSCCGNKEIEFVAEYCTGCIHGCTICIKACPFDEKGYKYVKNRFDKMNAKLKEKGKI